MSERRIRDQQRQRLYDAERTALDGSTVRRVHTLRPEFPQLIQCQDYQNTLGAPLEAILVRLRALQ